MLSGFDIDSNLNLVTGGYTLATAYNTSANLTTYNGFLLLTDQYSNVKWAKLTGQKYTQVKDA